MFPAIAILPLWLLVGWGVFEASGWAFLWVLFIAVPSVAIAQLVFALLVRARPSVMHSRAVSWWDVLGFTLWHGLTIAVGFYSERWFSALLAGAITAALVLFWLSMWQWRTELRDLSSAINLGNIPAQPSGRYQPSEASAPSQFARPPQPAVDPRNVTIIVDQPAPRDELRSHG